MSWNIGSSRNIFLSLRNKSKVFHVRLHYEIKKSSYTVFEALNFPKIDKLDSESNFSELKCVIHNGLRRTTLIYQSDKQEISISQHRSNGVQWSFWTKIELKKEKYKTILEHLSDLFSNVETFNKIGITLDK